MAWVNIWFFTFETYNESNKFEIHIKMIEICREVLDDKPKKKKKNCDLPRWMLLPFADIFLHDFISD